MVRVSGDYQWSQEAPLPVVFGGAVGVADTTRVRVNSYTSRALAGPCRVLRERSHGQGGQSQGAVLLAVRQCSSLKEEPFFGRTSENMVALASFNSTLQEK